MQYHISHKKIQSSTPRVRIVGVVYIVTIVWCVLWVATNLNHASIGESILSTLFLCALLLTSISGIITVINNWGFKMLPLKKITPGGEPDIAILIPTYNEPIEIVLKTLESIVEQNYPKEKIVVVVSDDGRNTFLQKAVESFAVTHIPATIVYHQPPEKTNPLRKGEAKSGNLNAAFDLVLEKFPHISFVETRDADDMVGNHDFLHYALEPLLRDLTLSFVQTVKKCKVSHHDPFSNQETLFYERIMPARYDANAVFPCGSGLVWRISELQRIGGFPSWNLVEDLQSGYEILQKKGKGAFLPVIGALGQIAPEDIPNFYKQRGTWALDTLRLFYWRNPLFAKGLTLRQKLHFFELGLYYLLSFATVIFIGSLIMSLAFNINPISSDQKSYLLHLGLFAITMELYNYIKARGVHYKDQWRTRQIQIGLAPIFIIASIKALIYGKNRKPQYMVTRKTHVFSFYWKQTLFQSITALALLGSIVFSFWTHQLSLSYEVVSVFWGVFFLFALLRTVKNSWFGVQQNSFARLFSSKKIALRGNI